MIILVSSFVVIVVIQFSNTIFNYRFEQIMNEMLGHLERQPMKKDRRVAWLRLIQPVFNAMGLVLLAHFRRIFSLFFHWMHADDDKTILLVSTKCIVW